MKSYKIKNGDHYIFYDSLYSRQDYMELYSIKLTYRESTWDDSDCIKVNVYRSKLLYAMMWDLNE